MFYNFLSYKNLCQLSSLNSCCDESKTADVFVSVHIAINTDYLVICAQFEARVCMFCVFTLDA
jgi:hypothetical protein